MSLTQSEPRRLCWNATQALTYPLKLKAYHLDLIEGELSGAWSDRGREIEAAGVEFIDEDRFR
jgi:hypothetical protein